MLQTDPIFSGSAKISGSLLVNGLDVTLGAPTDFSNLQNKPTLVSSSLQVLPQGSVSSSAQINLSLANGTAATATSASYATSTPTATLANTAYNNYVQSGSIKFWSGHQAAYNAISASADPNTIYFVH